MVEVSATHAIHVMESAETNLKTVQWRITQRRGVFQDFKEPPSFEFLGMDYTKGRVLFEPFAGRFLFDLNSVCRWVDGAAPYIAASECLAFDGEKTESLTREVHGTDIPKRNEAGAVRKIIKGRPEDWMNKWGLITGLSFAPPMFLGMPLSELLKAKLAANAPVKVHFGENGTWTITTTDDQPDSDLTIIYDLAKACVTSTAWSGGDPSTVWQKTTLDLQKLKDGCFFPRLVTNLYVLDRPANGYQFRYDDVILNEAVSPDAFKIGFP